MPPLPTTLAEFDAPWVTHALTRVFPGAEVSGVDIDEITHGTATRARLHLAYEDGSPSGPSTVWVKTGCEPHATYLATIGTYASEVRFYNELRDLVAVRTPACYYAEFDETMPQFVLLLEDLRARNVMWGAPGEVGDDQVEAALEALARVHARWWDDPALATRQWLQSTTTGGIAEHYRRRDAAVLTRALSRPRAAWLPPTLHDPAALVRAFRELLEISATPPLCLVHGDAHVGNVFFERDGTAGLLDWQGTKRARWAYDVAQLIVSALTVDARRGSEQVLLRFYLRCLADHGVAAPRWETAWLDYRRHTIYPLVGWLCTEGFQPESVSAANVAQFGAAAADFDVFELLA